jgi:hypothetical protein
LRIRPKRIRHVTLPGCKRNYIRVVRREMANRIGGVSISREDKSLAPAATVVDFAPVASAAGLLHPSGATKCFECWRVCPNIG